MGEMIMKNPKMYLVLELHKDGSHRIIGLYKSENSAAKAAYSEDRNGWCNIIEIEAKD